MVLLMTGMVYKCVYTSLNQRYEIIIDIPISQSNWKIPQFFSDSSLAHVFSYATTPLSLFADTQSLSGVSRWPQQSVTPLSK